MKTAPTFLSEWSADCLINKQHETCCVFQKNYRSNRMLQILISGITDFLVCSFKSHFFMNIPGRLTLNLKNKES